MFLSYESKFGWDKLLHGFLRLRLPKDQYSAYVRELHVYGNLAPTYKKSESNNQHKGYGSKLLWCSEWIAYIFGYKKMNYLCAPNVRWCNGSTAVFGTACQGSNPCRTTNLKVD